MELKDQTKHLFKGTLILTIAALLTKVLSAFYRIPFQNIVGDVGFYIYQQVYPFYGIAIALSTYGFPVVISKLYAEEMGKGENGNPKQLLGTMMIILCGFGFLTSALLFVLSDSIAHYMHDPGLAPLLRLVSLVFLMMPVISLLRGVFQGYGEMLPTAVSQVSEQLIRVITILVTALFLVSHGSSLYTVGAGAVFGSITGMIASFSILLFYWLRLQKRKPIIGKIQFKQTRNIFKLFLTQALPICISSMLLVLIQLADSLNLYSLLVSSGISVDSAKATKGVYDRGQPLIQLGTVVATSMSLSLVPLITKDKMQNHSAELKEKVVLALKTSILVGVGATLGLLSIIEPTNIMLFENNAGSYVLAVLTILILLASVTMTLAAIFQGLGFTIYPAVLVVLAFLLKNGLNTVLVPVWGILGAAISSVLALFGILVLFIIKLHRMVEESLLTLRFYIMTLLSALVMVIVLKGFLLSTHFIYDLDSSERLLASFQALAAVVIGGFAYIFMMIKTHLLTESDLFLLPFGSKLMVFLPKEK
ncbi:polysaccharide biosynthesis protein [Niallia sp. XMNu-256]|uniref:putative polysaccharide biosynthesis protein n=1 Tax=Niallia sp. XMNu-256 TaxID=3082444 RepID=UPI0030D54B94